MPGFAGDRRPYCTYNVFRDLPDGANERLFDTLPHYDGNGACFVPPYPVSAETHIMWHTNVVPPFPYHPVPLARTLSTGEIDELGRNVIRMLGEKEDRFGDPQEVLRNDCKFHILAVLAEMKLLPTAAVTTPQSAGSFRSAS
ncbi:MAG: hypothetical protein EOP88_24540 [Verrucomicrobiaceae bacterium]|nr:MAG: hypothetical protein EOP88_24540 [Verrucomicrobiaceae bacterium]